MFAFTNLDFSLATAVVLVCLVQTGMLLFGTTRRLANVLDTTHFKGSVEYLAPIAEKLLWVYLVVGIVGLTSPTTVRWWLLGVGVSLIVVNVVCKIVSRTRIVVPLDSSCDKVRLLGVMAIAPECRMIPRRWGTELTVTARSATEVQDLITYLRNSKCDISRRWVINSISKASGLAFAAGLLAMNLLHLYIDRLMLSD